MEFCVLSHFHAPTPPSSVFLHLVPLLKSVKWTQSRFLRMCSPDPSREAPPGAGGDDRAGAAPGPGARTERRGLPSGVAGQPANEPRSVCLTNLKHETQKNQDISRKLPASQIKLKNIHQNAKLPSARQSEVHRSGRPTGDDRACEWTRRRDALGWGKTMRESPGTSSDVTTR